MPKILVANVEEALPSEDMLFSHEYKQMSAGMFSRFLAELHPGDLLVAPFAIDRDYCRYMHRLIGIEETGDYVIPVGHDDRKLMITTALENEIALRKLRERCSVGDWVIDPFIETVNVLRLSNTLGIPTSNTDPDLIREGLIDNLNDKWYFKNMAREAGIPVVPGTHANNSIDLAAMLRNGGKRFRRIMLRKTKYAGGGGNCSGPARLLLTHIKDWYNIGTVLVEPFLNITEVAGSLVRITDDKLEFMNVDRQIFTNGSWCGFTAPFCTPGTEEFYKDFNVDAVREGALKLAKVAQERGARGLMNLDWAFVSGQHNNPTVLECNFRHNGFGYVLQLANSYFGAKGKEQAIYSREAIPCGFDSFERLRTALNEITLGKEKVFIDAPGAERGVIITNPPRAGKVSLAIFGPDQKYISNVWKHVEPVIERRL